VTKEQALEKQIADAISALRAARDEADSKTMNTGMAYRRLDAGIRTGLAILTRHDEREPLQATRARQ
jgi:hypothetical protein